MDSPSERVRRIRNAAGTPSLLPSLTKEKSRIGIRRFKHAGCHITWMFAVCFGGCLVLLLQATKLRPASSTYYEPLESILPSLPARGGHGEQSSVSTGHALKLPSVRINGVDDKWKVHGEDYANSRTTGSTLLLKKIDDKRITGILPLHVVVWPFLQNGTKTAEHQHIEENGISESSYLRLSKDMMDFHPNVVWLGDIGWGFPWKEWCQEYTKHIKKAKNMRREKGLPEQWPIFIVAFTDGPSLPRCQNVEAEVGKANVRYTSRSMVYDRRWNEAKKWVETGEKLNMMKSGIIYRHMPLVVRTDTVKFLEEALRKRNMTLADPVERLQRDVDVAHYWPHQRDLDKVGTVGSLLRQEISKLLFAFGKNTNFNVFVGLKGEAVRKGRRGVASDYIESLLETKIVVVSQRDRWEDHYRLMEALVGGALVLTDRVLGMPAGLENGTSVVEYDSADSLLSLIQYYLTHTEERLSIARKGREAAMKKHRTWHRIEEIIFGESLSDCRFQGSDSPCPYVVHGVESKR
jgi:hypothetical protein